MDEDRLIRKIELYILGPPFVGILIGILIFCC